VAAPDFRLMPGERLLWSGRPGQGILFSGHDAYLVPFSLLWGGFAVFWNVSVWREDDPLFFRLWGLPFLVAGLYFIAGRFLHDAWLRARTHYGVTDRRVLIARGSALRSLDRATLPLLDMEERRDGSGTIWFGDRPSPFDRRGSGVWTPAAGQTAQLQRISDVRSVYQFITSAPGVGGWEEGKAV
jgi:hypothetical protein